MLYGAKLDPDTQAIYETTKTF